jgi:hypothetical protein
MSKETGGPAFPVLHQNEITGYIPQETSGMTLRDYFAAKAMQASLTTDTTNALYATTHANFAYEVADAMLRAREQ